MITVTFDEQGKFENPNAPGHIFIAGFLYDDMGNAAEADLERKRIYRYYNAVCAKAGTDYPQDLHVSGSLNNGQKVKETKNVVSRTLGSFLKDGVFLDPQDGDEADTFGMEHRKGKYYLFMKLRSEKGRKDLLDANADPLIKDSYAGNLYIHMVEETVDMLVFHNPLIDSIDEVFFDLPTRMAEGEGSRKNQFEHLDYREYKTVNPNVKDNMYQIGNADVYRTALDYAKRNTSKKIKIREFRVSPIRYSDNSFNSMSFLHLADSLCSLIGYQPSSLQPGKWIKEVRNVYKELSGHDHNLVFAYDDADAIFQNAYKAYEKGDMFQALSALYEGKNCSTSMAGYYSDTWYEKLEEKITACDDLNCFKKAAEALKNSIYSGSIEQEKVLYVFECLRRVCEKLENRKEAADAIYALYDAGISVYNHTGQSEKALECLKHCANVSKNQGIDQFVRTRNKLAVAYCDSLRFDEALKTVNDTIAYEEQLKELRQLMMEDETASADSQARAFSQRAQIYAFLQDERAEEDFLKALSIFSSDQGDYLITLSYLLHYYLQTGEQEKYEKYAGIYFRSEDLYSQFVNMIADGTGNHPRLNLKFSLYVFVKAVWTFYLDQRDSRLKTALLNMDSALMNRNKETRSMMSGHPWELIYKYLAFYAYHSANPKKAEDYMEKAQTVLNARGAIIDLINENSLQEYERMKNGEEIIDHSSGLTYMYR